jgi:hypothetical protein
LRIASSANPQARHRRFPRDEAPGIAGAENFIDSCMFLRGFRPQLASHLAQAARVRNSHF